MTAFTYQASPGRIVFGPGALAAVGGEVASLGGTRVLLIASPSAKVAADQLAEELGPRLVRRWDEVAQHVPVELAARAREAVEASGANSVVAVGGGSAIGLGKAVALSHPVAVVAVPTTYSGSEMTDMYGLTGGAHKQTGKSARVRPHVVVYDPALTVSLPPQVTGPSAFNALAHAIESLWVVAANPITATLALEGVRRIAAALPAVMDDPSDLAARGDLLLGACLAGQALGATGTGLHHKVCHVLGGMFNLVHADTHAAVLPHVVALNGPAIPAEMAALAAALGAAGDDPAGALWRLARLSHVTGSLAALGMPAEGIASAAERAAGEISANPVAVDEATLRSLLAAAHAGTAPRFKEASQ